jgi:hypothetical protein
MKLESLKQLPNWLLLLLAGATLVVLGSTTRVAIGKNSLSMSYPYNVVVIVVGVLLLLVGFLEFRRARRPSDGDPLVVKQVHVNSAEIVPSSNPLRVRVTGRIEPAMQGIHVWIAREHQSQSPGRFHLGDKPALTDKNGDWQQFTYLWPEGTFRIHAVVANRAAESLFIYYRKAYDHARSVYQQKVDENSDNFPGWPALDELPPGCVSDFQAVTV